MVAPPVQDLEGAFQSMAVKRGQHVTGGVLAHGAAPVEAADEQAPTVGSVDQPVREGELLGLGAIHHEGEALLRVQQQATGGRRDAVQPVEGQPRQGGRGGGRGGDRRQTPGATCLPDGFSRTLRWTHPPAGAAERPPSAACYAPGRRCPAEGRPGWSAGSEAGAPDRATARRGGSVDRGRSAETRVRTPAIGTTQASDDPIAQAVAPLTAHHATGIGSSAH
jgi:hypothetical protein